MLFNSVIHTLRSILLYRNLWSKRETVSCQGHLSALGLRRSFDISIQVCRGTIGPMLSFERELICCPRDACNLRTEDDQIYKVGKDGLITGQTQPARPKNEMLKCSEVLDLQWLRPILTLSEKHHNGLLLTKSVSHLWASRDWFRPLDHNSLWISLISSIWMDFFDLAHSSCHIQMQCYSLSGHRFPDKRCHIHKFTHA